LVHDIWWTQSKWNKIHENVAYRGVFLDFVYESHPLTLENNFTNSDKEQYQGGPSGEPPKV